MTISFYSLPLSASRFDIYSQAGLIFEEQVRNDRWTDYTKSEAFNTAIWYIAQKACGRGFSALQYMKTEQVASGMGNYISAYIAAQRHGGVAPLIFAALFAALGVAAIAQPHLLLALAIKAAALAHAHPQLTANMLITAAQKVIGGETPANVARAVAIKAGGAIVAQPLESWLAGLKIHP